MKYIFFTFLTGLSFVCCIGQQKRDECWLQLNNPLAYDRPDALIEFSVGQIVSLLRPVPGEWGVYDEKNLLLPGQLLRDDKGAPQTLLFQLSLKANETKRVCIKKETRLFIPPKVYGRYVPERLGDFAWENNRIAFRVYGEECEISCPLRTCGFDVWAKRTEDLVINKWYAYGNDGSGSENKKSYHIDYGEGCDYYDVGNTLGAGGIAPFFRDSVFQPHNYKNYRILESGPLRFVFELFYEPWEVPGGRVEERMRITLDANSQFNKVEAYYQTEVHPFSAAIGLAKRADPGIYYADTAKGIMTYWEPDNKLNGRMGVGVFVPKHKVDQLKEEKNQYLMILPLSRVQSVVYYAGAGWSKGGRFADQSGWVKYVERFAEMAMHPVTVSIIR